MRIELESHELNSYMREMQIKDDQFRMQIERLKEDCAHIKKERDEALAQVIELEKKNSSLNGKIDAMQNRIKKLERFEPALTKKEMENERE